MCDVHPETSPIFPTKTTRRQVLKGLAGASITAVAAPGATGAAAATGGTPGVVRAALHVHASFSEGSTSLTGYRSTATMASMESQLVALRRLGADLCWFTEHDHQLAAETPGMRPRAFPEYEDLARPHWTYRRELLDAASGTAALTSAGLQATVSSGSSSGWSGMFVDCGPTDRDYRAPLSGTTVGITATTTTRGWVEARLRCSYRPARAGRSAGSYEVHYRLDPTAVRRSVTTRGTVAVVTVPHPAGQRATATSSPVDDLAAAFPDLGTLAHDNGLYGVWLGVASAPGRTGSGTIHGLRLNRTLAGGGALGVRSSILTELRRQLTGVHSAPGLEASYSTHLNVLAGGGVPLAVSDPAGAPSADQYLRETVSRAAADGAVCAYNHPFASHTSGVGSPAEQAKLLAGVATQLQSNRLYGARLIEVGYLARGGADLRTHLDLWDILLCAGLRVFAIGTSDNHVGTLTSWESGPHPFFTDILADQPYASAALPALRAGRCFVSHRTGFGGRLDLESSSARMGGEQRVTQDSVDIQVVVEGAPAGGRVVVRRHVVDGGQRTTPPPVAWSQTVDAAAFTSGPVTLTMRVGAPSYVRAEIVDGSGAVVSFSNPLWITPA